jgi:hypothetical protein
MEQTNTGVDAPATRPKFLNVLCILSYIGTGLGVIMGIYHLATAGAAQAGVAMLDSMSSSNNSMSSVPGMDSMMAGAIAAAKYVYVLAGVEIATNLLCLFGVLQMSKLKKMGYYLYVVGQLTAIIVPIVLVGFGGLFGGIMIAMAIFPIAFIIMYGVNLKHMS